jgi:hypothetical protein
MKFIVIDCFWFIITLLDSTTQSQVGVFFLNNNHLASSRFVEVEIRSTFQTQSNIYTDHAVRIVEQYIGAAENCMYSTKQISENVRLMK